MRLGAGLSRQGLRDRANFVSVAAIGFLSVAGLGAVAKTVGVTGMTFIAIGLFLLTVAVLAWMATRLKALGLQPPPFSEIRRASVEDPSEGS
jgi:hypothetical protein